MIFKPFFSSILNAFTLVVFGLWGFLSVPGGSFTALIPVFGAIIIFIFLPGLKNENRKAAHIVVIITFILLLGLIKPLTGAIERSNSSALFRVLTMMFTSLFAMATYIKSFIDARKSRTN